MTLKEGENVAPTEPPFDVTFSHYKHTSNINYLICVPPAYPFNVPFSHYEHSYLICSKRVCLFPPQSLLSLESTIKFHCLGTEIGLSLKNGNLML